MKVDALLKELEGSLPIAALNEFNTAVEESSEPHAIIHELLLTSRKCNEILDLLLAEKRTSSELATIFITLGHIVLNIAGEITEYTHVGLHITQQVLHNHETAIYKLTGHGITNRSSKAMLRCLTGMVMLGEEAASDVLSTLDWGRINIGVIAHRQNSKDVYDVRAWCIYLILAFLNSHKESCVITQFLQKDDLLPAIFPGLLWDPCERVINVLKVMRESVLFNPNVTKTMKIAIFTPERTKYLLYLYKWKGPVGKLATGEDLEDLDSDLAKEVLSERAQIKEVLHPFMLILFTSATRGIIFTERIQEGAMKSNNLHSYRILLHLKTPWQSPEERELMGSFLGKCPDLLRTYLASLKDSLEPRPTTGFVSLMDMVTCIIDSQKPWLKIETHGLQWAVGCIIPQPLVYLYIKSLLESCDISVRYSGIMLVLAMLSKTKETIENIMNSKQLSQKVKHENQENVKKIVLKVLKPSIIITCWKLAFYKEITDTMKMEGTLVQHLVPPQKISELLKLIKVLSLYNEMQPIEAIYEIVDPLKVLEIIHMVPVDDDDCSEEYKEKIELQMMCLELMAHNRKSLESVIDTLTTADEFNEKVKENILYKLISIYVQAKRASVTNKSEDLKVLLIEKCCRILSNVLAEVGLPAHYDGSIKVWLKHITLERETKLTSFLTKVIQKTVSSLHHYTDVVIKMKSQLRENTSQEMGSSFTESFETMEVVDNQEVSNLSVSMPFSRLVLGAVNLLEEESDPDCIDYFSKVITDYQYSVNDPELLTAFLLHNEKVMTPTLVNYLRAWCRETSSKSQDVNVLAENSNLSEILKYLFMTDDVQAVENLLSLEKLTEVISTSDLDLIISQIILYIHLKLGMKKNKKVLKKYADLLKEIYSFLEDNDPNKAEHVLQTVLEHPLILTAYKPFSSKNFAVTELIQDFIAAISAKQPELVSKVVPYFHNIMKALEFHLNRNDVVNYWDPLSPFIMLSHTVVSYEAAEQMLTACLKTPCSISDALETLLIELLKLISRTTSFKRKLKEETVELLFSKFYEWGRAKEVSASHEILTQRAETLLIQVLSPAAIEQLTAGNLKSLLQFQPPCPDLCCHIVKQHPQHSHTLAKYLKKHGTILPHQAPLLAQLLNQNDIAEKATGALIKVLSEIKTWILDFEGEEDKTSLLLPHIFSKGLLDEETLTDVCHKLYEEIVTKKQSPPKKLMCLLPVFKVLKTFPADLPGEHLSVLHICLSCIKMTYQKENQQSGLLLSVVKLVNDIVAEVDESSLQSNLTSNKLWSSFAKQVLRVGITDPILGPDLVQTLAQLSSFVYRKDGKSIGGECVLPINTLYQMIMAHSQYLALMFNEEEEWEKLKEKVVLLQQTLVDCEESVCQENHVPILLGAYGASMSLLDQRILKLLFTYEKKGYMTSYQPVLWGKAAIVHFGVKTQNIGFFRDPMPEQVLGQLSMDKILHTCYNFNTRLPLEPTDISKEDKTVYDVRFLLPLMLYLSEEERLSEIDYAETGAAVLGLIALTSHEQPVWGAGAAILRCMVHKMEKSRHKRLSLPWFWLVGVVSCALKGKQRRLPALTTHFLIHASQLLSQPEHPLYYIVLNYVYLKPDFKLYLVPELFRLYNSAHITDSEKHRSFLLSILSSGIRQILDYKISQRSFTATLMMGMLQAPSDDNELKVQVLEVLEAMVRIPLGAVELVVQHSLLTVLSAVSSPDTHDPSSSKSSHLLLLSSVVKVLNALWETLFQTTVREDIVASDIPDKQLLEVDDSHTKRKADPETKTNSPKRIRLDSCSKDFDEDVNEDEKLMDSNVPVQKLLPPLFVYEYLNTLKLLLPVVIANSPLTTVATHLQLVSDTLHYVETIRESVFTEKQRIRLVAMAPDIMKEQVSKRIQWNILHDLLQGFLTDDEEVRLLGTKSKDFLEKWRSEPLSVALQKLEHIESDGEKSPHDIMELKEAVLKLLNVLGR
ncbi:nucleolar pre-ribosomal-associated protein 1-like [Portunus trituberculatus]|uniref:nucleolar pre-ribosomal-associated protein 1-like n=1 Tax=Portunus trituberculatus TaxID=210409 RepID=UPI001E1CFAB2|nr:nucleolar pre-ribosomal-associated protein 1-like [Portunus trituberculatus]